MPQGIFQKPAIVIMLIGCFWVLSRHDAKPALGDELPDAGSVGVWQKVAVEKGFDNAPFNYRIRFLSQRNGYRVFEIKYLSPVKSKLDRNNTVTADYYLPDGFMPGDAKSPTPRRPAVICLPILDGNDALTDLVCSVLALRGVPSIMFRLPYYGERGLPGGPEVLARDPKMFAGAIAQAGADLRRTIDVLASRPEVDAGRIGVTGISLGGIIASTAAGGEPRINRAALLLAGGDLMNIIHHARETKPLSKMILALPPAERELIEDKIAQVDPLRFAAGLKEKARQGKVMMVNAAEDEVIPRACTEKLAAAIEMSDRVVWIDGLGHYTSMAELPKVLKTTADFFAQDLPPGVKPPVVEKKDSPFQAIAGLCTQIAAILYVKPEAGRCHIVDLDVTILRMDQTRQEGHFRLVRGGQGKFAFSCKVPPGIEISIGQNDHPWMATGGKEVYEGTENPGPALKDLTEIIDHKQTSLLRMLCGMLDSVSLAPDVLDRLIIAKDDGDVGFAGSVRVIKISARENEKYPGDVRLELKPEVKADSITQTIAYAPQIATFEFPGIKGSVKFVEWKLNAPAQDSLFQPPADLPSRKVDEGFLYTLFSTSLKYVLPTGE